MCHTYIHLHVHTPRRHTSYIDSGTLIRKTKTRHRPSRQYSTQEGAQDRRKKAQGEGGEGGSSSTSRRKQEGKRRRSRQLQGRRRQLQHSKEEERLIFLKQDDRKKKLHKSIHMHASLQLYVHTHIQGHIQGDPSVSCPVGQSLSHPRAQQSSWLNKQQISQVETSEGRRCAGRATAHQKPQPAHWLLKVACIHSQGPCIVIPGFLIAL